MDINQIAIDALKSIADTYPDVYIPDAVPIKTKYITIGYATIPDDYSDDIPHAEKYLMQIKYCCPLDYDSIADRKAIKKALFSAGMNYPSVTPLSDETAQIYLFECEIVEGIDYSG